MQSATNERKSKQYKIRKMGPVCTYADKRSKRSKRGLHWADGAADDGGGNEALRRSSEAIDGVQHDCCKEFAQNIP